MVKNFINKTFSLYTILHTMNLVCRLYLLWRLPLAIFNALNVAAYHDAIQKSPDQWKPTDSFVERHPRTPTWLMQYRYWAFVRWHASFMYFGKRVSFEKQKLYRALLLQEAFGSMPPLIAKEFKSDHLLMGLQTKINPMVFRVWSKENYKHLRLWMYDVDTFFDLGKPCTEALQFSVIAGDISHSVYVALEKDLARLDDGFKIAWVRNNKLSGIRSDGRTINDCPYEGVRKKYIQLFGTN